MKGNTQEKPVKVGSDPDGEFVPEPADETDGPAGVTVPSPLSPAAIADLRALADRSHPDDAAVLRLHADWHDANRRCNAAQVYADGPALNTALLDRSLAAGELRSLLDGTADRWLMGFRLAVARRPAAFAEAASVALGETYDEVRTDLNALADAIVGRRHAA